MASLDRYREIIENILTEYTKIPYAYGDIQIETVFDRKNDHYLLVNVGWNKFHRIYGTLVHIDIINGKIWIQWNGTEDEIAKELVKAGVPKEQIVLGFQPVEVRPLTEYAVA
jgi:hypothetical protein